jgi:hypothetical protein
VYVGAISILFLFVIILLNIRERPQFEIRLKFFVVILILLLPFSPTPGGSNSFELNYTSLPLNTGVKSLLPGYNSVILPDVFSSSLVSGHGDIKSLTKYLYTQYSL